MTFFVAESPERHVWGPRVFASRGSWHGHLQSPDRLAGHLGRVCRQEQAERGTDVQQVALGAWCFQPCCAPHHSFYTFCTFIRGLHPTSVGGQ